MRVTEWTRAKFSRIKGILTCVESSSRCSRCTSGLGWLKEQDGVMVALGNQLQRITEPTECNSSHQVLLHVCRICSSCRCVRCCTLGATWRQLQVWKVRNSKSAVSCARSPTCSSDSYFRERCVRLVRVPKCVLSKLHACFSSYLPFIASAPP